MRPRDATVKKFCPRRRSVRHRTDSPVGSALRFSDLTLGGLRMSENGGNLHRSLSDEILSLIESDTRFWNDAADRCEHVAGTVADEREKREWELMAAVYRERVSIHAVFVAKLRERLDGSVSSSSKSVRSILTTRT